jgi:hypothetical protein
MSSRQKWYPNKPEFVCSNHGPVEPRQVVERVQEFSNCTMSVVRMECPVCGQAVSRIDPEWKELRELLKNEGRSWIEGSGASGQHPADLEGA